MAKVDGPAYEAMASAMNDAYGTPMTTLGQGGSIPLCNVFADTYPDAELIMIGVEEPMALIHAPNESVAPSEIQSMALPRHCSCNAMQPRGAVSLQPKVLVNRWELLALRLASQRSEAYACGLPQRQRSHARCPWLRGDVP